MNDVIKIVSWNIGQRNEAWEVLLNSGVDVALLQEAKQPPASVKDRIHVDDLPWRTRGRSDRSAWRTCVARLSDRVRLRHRPLASIETLHQDTSR